MARTVRTRRDHCRTALSKGSARAGLPASRAGPCLLRAGVALSLGAFRGRRGHEEHHDRSLQAPRRGAGKGPQSLARGDRAGDRGRARRRSRDRDPRRVRRPDHPGDDRRGSAPLRPQPRPPADRPGLCRRRGAGRSARGRDLRHEAGFVRLHRAGPGLRVSARRVPRALHRQMDDQGRLCRVRRSARRAHSRRLVCRGHRRRAFKGIARDDPTPRGEPFGPRRHGAAAGKARARCRRPSRSPRRRCARSRRARMAAISTSSS